MPKVLHVVMPTTRPRYTITDTGSVRELLHEAQRQWPGARDRKELLLRLARTGHDALNLERLEAGANDRRERQRTAQSLVDWEAVRDDQAWN